METTKALTVLPAQEEPLRVEGMTILEHAKKLVVESHDDAERGVSIIRKIKDYRAKVKELMDPMVKSTNEAHKIAVAKKKERLAASDAAERIIKDKISTYDHKVEQERKRAIAEAEEQARKERERLLRAAEKKIDVLAGKAKDVEGQITLLREALRSPDITDVEMYAIESRIEILEFQLKGKTEKIEAKRRAVEESVFIPPVVAPTHSPPVSKIAGVSKRKITIPVVVNPMAVIRAVASGAIPVDVIQFNMATLKKLLDAGVLVPGIKKETKRDISVRR